MQMNTRTLRYLICILAPPTLIVYTCAKPGSTTLVRQDHACSDSHIHALQLELICITVASENHHTVQYSSSSSRPFYNTYMYTTHRRLPLRPPFLLVLSDGIGVTSSGRKTGRKRYSLQTYHIRGRDSLSKVGFVKLDDGRTFEETTGLH